MVVVFPAPFGPRNPKTSPAFSVNETFSTMVRLPKLVAVQLNSPEAHAQYRLAILARLATGGAPWFTLAFGA